ncbi:MAG TPA: fibronectin type III domain-containing protein, partial [Spirochaetota bacterium]|nr:fibronectin type III domain-containing protein [Spirochaetota bacterium]
MKKIIIALFVLFVAFPASAEYLFLTDGRILKGAIVRETGGEYVFQDEWKKTAAYPRRQVMRVLYTDLNMGRIYLQLRNGKNMRVYLVDESRSEYTFRKDISKPEEFQLSRKEVLFVAERNPSGLKGDPGYHEIALDWYASYDRMKHYKIYRATGSEAKYVPVATSSKNEYIMKDLKSHTAYRIMVTAVDMDGMETPPSNEITVTTLNIPPTHPRGVSVSRSPKGERLVSWRKSTDPDGTVVG